jgi:phosphoribosylamine--glycine ligase
MKVFVIGSGGREHALCWALSKCEDVEKIYVAPGNGGTGEVAENVDLTIENIPSLVRFAKNNDIDLTIPGPEAVLAEGVVDAFLEAGLKIFGPTKAGAEIESSKSFAKNLMRKYGIPTADFATFDRAEDAIRYLQDLEYDVVVKADGLAAGKGVIVCSGKDEAIEAVNSIMEDAAFGRAGDRIVIEEKMVGEEVSILALTDGKAIAPLASAQDHKPAYDNDEGPNTGGMGAYSPAPVLTDELLDQVIDKILVPTVHAMNNEGRRYKGVLYAGLMITKSGPKVVEFNCRFGDPEIQPISMRLKTDMSKLLMSVVENKLGNMKIDWHDETAVSVVMASGGYPGSYKKGVSINGIDTAEKDKNVKVFHAGTEIRGGQLVTSGGRVLNVTALGSDVEDAMKNAYNAVEKISFEGAQWRTDIGKKALVRLGLVK